MLNLLYRSSSTNTPPTATSAKGAPITIAEFDANLKSIADNVDSKAPIQSPTFTGTPQAPTATASNSSKQIATTEFVSSAISTAVAQIDASAQISNAISAERTVTATLTNKTLTNPAFTTLNLVEGPGGVTPWDMNQGSVAFWPITATGRSLSAPTNYKSGVIYTLFVSLSNPATMSPTLPSSVFKYQYDVPPDFTTSNVTVLSLIWSPLHNKFCVFPAPGL